MFLWLRALTYMLLIGGGWLIVIPAAIHLLEHGHLRPDATAFPWPIVALVTLLAGATIAVYAGWHLITYGMGTPFPLDRTRHLVTTGPYRFVRNPQGIAMLLMTLGVVLFVKSTWLWLMLPATLIYLELIVGPIEEKQLRRDFGDEFLAYKKRVGRWIPCKTLERNHIN